MHIALFNFNSGILILKKIKNLKIILCYFLTVFFHSLSLKRRNIYFTEKFEFREFRTEAYSTAVVPLVIILSVSMGQEVLST